MAAVAGVVQRAGVDVTSWDEVQRRLGKCGSTSRTTKTIGTNKLIILSRAPATCWESPAFGADRTGSDAVGDRLTACTSRSGIPLVVIANEIVGVISIAINNGAVSAFCGHGRHRIGDFGPVAGRTDGSVLVVGVTVRPAFAGVVDIKTWVEGVGAVVIGGVVDILDCGIGGLGSVVTGRIPNGAIREVGLSGEAVLVGETTFGDIEVEVLRHPALFVGEFGHPVEFSVAGVGEAVGLSDGGGVTDFCGHILHVGDLGEVGDIGGVSHHRHHYLVRIGPRW